ncbi:MAG: transcriptional regulator, BadM/Rrf2 family [Oscillospiraceae bacterium]|nr:transcriptional regulator, BadM/Rrf2 family [Oscillospiraceae bacterium]
MYCFLIYGIITAEYGHYPLLFKRSDVKEVKISTKGRYALRFMFDLSLHYGKGLVPLKEISKRQNISGKYLEQIIMNLNKAGLVRSVRGSQGGYSLKESPENIIVGDILRAVEGSLSPVECVDDKNCCEKHDTCGTIIVWEKLKKAVDDVIDNITLKDLVDDYLSKSQSEYYI